MNEFQRRGTTFPITIDGQRQKDHVFTLMDTGAIRSCINYSTFEKLNNVKLSHKEVPKVLVADRNDLGLLESVELKLLIGTEIVTQEFILCRQLRRNIILGVDFGQKNCAGIHWTTQKTRVLSIKGIPAIKIEENKLGTPATAAFHVKVPPCHNGVFQVKVHGDMNGNYIITSHPQWEEKNPNLFQHEIAIVTDDEADPFPLAAVTNLDHAKTLHIGKGEIIGFAKTENKAVTYIATTNEINIEENRDITPKNWIPKRKQVPWGNSENTINRQDDQRSDHQGGEDCEITKLLQTRSKNSEK